MKNSETSSCKPAGASAISEAVVKTADISLGWPDSEIIRRVVSDRDCSAYYDISTNEKLSHGTEDLFQVISQMKRRFVWDVNSKLPSKLDANHAFICGQTFDHEDCLWQRREIRGGSENIFAFGVKELLERNCLHIHRLRQDFVAALHKQRRAIPNAAVHYSDESRLAEVEIINKRRLLGKKHLTKEIAEFQPLCAGNYYISVRVARCCAALLLDEDALNLTKKVEEERDKFSKNHPNALGDTQLIQNALYFSAEVLTNDAGAKQMARYCGLKPANEFLVSV